MLNGINDPGSFVTQEQPMLLVAHWPGRTKLAYWIQVFIFAGYLAFPLFIQGPPRDSLEFWKLLFLWDFVAGLFPWIIFLSLQYSSIPKVLRLDLASRTYQWERGWPPHPNTVRGTFADIRNIRTFKSYSKAHGALYYIVVLVWRRRYYRVGLGKFLSCGKAEDLARDCADRLGVPLELTTAPPPETWLDKKLW
jgi:hypothetical protein